MRALVVEDQQHIAELNRRLLEQERFDVDVALTANEGVRLARANDYTLIVLDMILPDGHGMNVLKAIRERSQTTPVLILSGEDDVDVTVGALDAGADDYLTKPYQAVELTARIRALTRRGQLVQSTQLVCGNVVLHRMERHATVGGVALSLTVKEFSLLETFMQNRGKTLTRESLLKTVWRFDFDPNTNMLDVNVSRLRAKLVALKATSRLDARRGVGYVFDEA
ncbi:MAG: response regulator transcription factor [bacterium]